MGDDAAWIALSLLPHIGGKTLRSLVAHFGSAEAVLKADVHALQAVHGIGEKIANSILQDLDLARTRREIAHWQTQGIRILPRYNAAYPPLLRDMNDEPPTLFLRGQYDFSHLEKTVALVGSRQASQENQQRAFRLGTYFAKQGYLVVSGLALGIDSAAHNGALAYRNGKTLAVMGSGVLDIYPPQNRRLAARILQRGAILSENHPSATANAARLVARNRIISGLAQMLVVVETALEGGAMYAARHHLALERPVYTFDLPYTGNQALLREGAQLLNLDNDV